MWLKSKKEIKKERTGHGGMLMALFPRFFFLPPLPRHNRQASNA